MTDREQKINALAESTANLLAMFKESHEEEIESGHFGDDEAGHPCSYCEAIAETEAALNALIFA